MFYPLLLSYFFLFIYSFPTCSISLCLYSLVLSSVIHFSIFASFFYCSSLTFFLKRYYFYIFFSLLLLSILSLYVFTTFILLKLFSLLLWRIAKKANRNSNVVKWDINNCNARMHCIKNEQGGYTLNNSKQLQYKYNQNLTSYKRAGRIEAT